ncbi:hypothetical protein EYV94_13465 [Puteibacter caeruleilacunae]|nr:hypothetical protein EYV94_13465 [Puteibacter caeruleilacunae]
MEVIFEFIIRTSIGITAVFLMYWLLLRKLTYFRLNRYFLITGLLGAILIAAFPMSYEVLIPAVQPITYVDIATDSIVDTDIQVTEMVAENNFSLTYFVLLVYLVGIIAFSLRLVLQCKTPVRIIRKTAPEKVKGCLLYKDSTYPLPFSFFDRIIIHPKYFKQKGLDDILTHEKVHIQERHWIDLLIVQLLTIFFWFNPFIWLLERAMKQNHEYLADKGVLTRGQSPVRYQAILINQLMGMQVIGLANNLNFALGPTRLKMMTQERTPKRKLYRFALGLPLLAILLVAFAQPEYKVEKQQETTTVKASTSERKITLSDGTKVTLTPNSKLEYPEKFDNKERVVRLDGEAYFDVSKSEKEFKVVNPAGNVIATSSAEKAKGKVIIRDNSKTYIYSDKVVEYSTRKDGEEVVRVVNGDVKPGKGDDFHVENLTSIRVFQQGDYDKQTDILLENKKNGSKVEVFGENTKIQSLGSQTKRPLTKEDKANLLRSARGKMTVHGNARVRVNKKTVIRGMVVDSKGNPLKGASVILTGTTKGAVTDADGKWKIEIDPGNVFAFTASYVGYKTVSNQLEINQKEEDMNYIIKLKKSAIKLDNKSLYLTGTIPPPPPPKAPSGEKADFVIVEDIPHYKQGMHGLNKYLKSYIQKNKEELFFEGITLKGKGAVGFTISKTGNVENIKVIQPSDKHAANAIVKMLKHMEQWKPGMQHGQAVPVDYIMEIDFDEL